MHSSSGSISMCCCKEVTGVSGSAMRIWISDSGSSLDCSRSGVL